MDAHYHIKAPLQTDLQTGQVIFPSSPVPAPARGKDSSHHAPEFIFNPGPCGNRKRGRMKNLITGTSTEVSWLHITQVGAASPLLSTQTQAEISPVSSGQAATPQLLSKAATHLSHLSLLLSCWTPCLPRAMCVNAGQALLQAGDHRISSCDTQGNGGQHPAHPPSSKSLSQQDKGAQGDNQDTLKPRRGFWVS